MISHWIGWATVTIGVSELLCFVARRTKRKSVQKIRGKHHMIWGKILLSVGFIHGALTCIISPTGILLWSCYLCLYLSYRYKKNLGKNWMTLHRTLSILSIVLTIMHIIFRIK